MREGSALSVSYICSSFQGFCLSVGLNDIGNIISVVAVIDCFTCLYCDLLVILMMGLLFRVLQAY